MIIGTEQDYQNLLNTLIELHIDYKLVDHPAADSTEEADKYIEGMDGVPSKTMFMAGKKDKNFYLFVLNDTKRLDIKKLNNLIGDKLHFGKEDDLKQKMNLVPGMVSIFGLLNNKDHDIKVFIDKAITYENKITFHPNDNTTTMFISVNDMYKFLNTLDYKYEIIDM